MEMDMLIVIATVALVVFLVIGLVKRTFWMCMVAIAIAALLGITQPDQFVELKESFVSLVDGSIDPLKDDNYADIAGEAGIVDEDKMNEIDRDQSDIQDFDGK